MCVQLDDDIISIAVVLFHFPSLFVDQKKKKRKMKELQACFYPQNDCHCLCRVHDVTDLSTFCWSSIFIVIIFYSSLSLMPYVDK
jgi:hypothetical protein